MDIFEYLPGEIVCHIARFVPHEDLISFLLIKQQILLELKRHDFFRLKCLDLSIRVRSAKEILVSKMTAFRKCPRCPKQTTLGIIKQSIYKGGWSCNYCGGHGGGYNDDRYVCAECWVDVCKKCDDLLHRGRVTRLRLRCDTCQGKVYFGKIGKRTTYKGGNFSCTWCRKSYRSTIYRYQCKKCPLDICMLCMAEGKPSEEEIKRRVEEERIMEEERRKKLEQITAQRNRRREERRQRRQQQQGEGGEENIVDDDEGVERFFFNLVNRQQRVSTENEEGEGPRLLFRPVRIGNRGVELETTGPALGPVPTNNSSASQQGEDGEERE